MGIPSCKHRHFLNLFNDLIVGDLIWGKNPWIGNLRMATISFFWGPYPNWFPSDWSENHHGMLNSKRKNQPKHDPKRSPKHFIHWRPSSIIPYHSIAIPSSSQIAGYFQVISWLWCHLEWPLNHWYNYINGHFLVIWVIFDVIYPSSFIKWPDQWIGLRENLQESPMIFMGKSMVSGFNFPVKTNPGWPENLASLCWKNRWMGQVFIAYAADIGWDWLQWTVDSPDAQRALDRSCVWEYHEILYIYITIYIYIFLLYFYIYIYILYCYIYIYIHYITIYIYIY